MHALRYAIRPLPVLKYFGQLCMVLSLLTLVPLAVSIIFGNYQVSIRYSIVVVGIFITGFFLQKLPTPRRIQTNEAMVITAFVFLFTALVMTWPVMGSGLSFLDALFETTSAVTTTGLSSTASVEDKPAIFLFSRAWMQWIGGLGVVILYVAIMIQPGLAAKRIGDLENYEDDLIGSTRTHARRVLIVYSILTVAGIAVLGLMGAGWLNSVVYSLSAVSTGGFSPHDNSLAGLGSQWMQAMVVLLSIAGAIPLVLYFRTYRKGWKTLIYDRQVQVLFLSGLLTALLMVILLFTLDGMKWSQALYHGVINAFSAQSTAGFASLDISQINEGSKLTLIISMFLGGSSGSTAGGVKILRLLILLQLLYVFVQRACMPRQAVLQASLGRYRLGTEEIQNALSIIFVFLIVITTSWLVFVVMGYDPFNSLFEVVSATGTVGLSAGITAPDLHPLLKGVLCADMFLGRLEILAWLVVFYPRTWIGRRLEE
ncbi:MAG: TrkH family potassium uptake protein [Dehalococcoidales bacterium]|nr:TrkH family potassium uptake protein [Dehalococcoidales bacterium]